MTCKRCGSKNINRSRRRGLIDQLKAALGRWPFRCESCAYRFAAPHRHVVKDETSSHSTAEKRPESGTSYRKHATQSAKQGPEMAFRTQGPKPHAKIVLQAETHEQLDQILLALDRAVNAYGPSTRPQAYSVMNERTASSAR